MLLTRVIPKLPNKTTAIPLSPPQSLTTQMPHGALGILTKASIAHACVSLYKESTWLLGLVQSKVSTNASSSYGSLPCRRYPPSVNLYM